jgi:hypothetical protein
VQGIGCGDLKVQSAQSRTLLADKNRPDLMDNQDPSSRTPESLLKTLILSAYCFPCVVQARALAAEVDQTLVNI